jgi:hypothetical protein
MGFRIPDWCHEPLEHRNARVMDELSDDWATELAMGAGADERAHALPDPVDAKHDTGRAARHVGTPGHVGARSHSHTTPSTERNARA